MALGLKVSKPGFEVLTAAPKDLTLTSDVISPKIRSILTDQFVKTGNGGETFEIAHDLGYTPAYFLYVNPAGRWWGELGEDFVTGLEWVSWADDSKLYIYAINGDTAVFDVKVFILVDESDETEAETEILDLYGIKVSKPGADVFTAPDQKLVFGTALPTFKVVDIAEFEYNAETGEKTYPHGLGYPPAWQAILSPDPATGVGVIPLPYLFVGNLEYHVWSDDTNVGVRVESTAPGGETVSVRVVIFDNQLE